MSNEKNDKNKLMKSQSIGKDLVYHHGGQWFNF